MPVPVWACPTTSLPVSRTGIAASCMGNALSKPRSLMASSSSCFIPSSSNCAIFLTQQWPNALPLRHYSGGAPGALLLNHGGPARSSRMRLPAVLGAPPPAPPRDWGGRTPREWACTRGASRRTCALVGCRGAAGGLPRARARTCPAPRPSAPHSGASCFVS